MKDLTDRQNRAITDLISWAENHSLPIKHNELVISRHDTGDSPQGNVTVTYLGPGHVVTQYIDPYGHGPRAIGEVVWLYDESDPDHAEEDTFQVVHMAKPSDIDNLTRRLNEQDEKIAQLHIMGHLCDERIADLKERLRRLEENDGE